jgi:hypothetical protein
MTMKNDWNTAQQIGFRFTFLFFGQLIFVDIFGRILPFISQFLHWLVPLFSKTFGIVPHDIVTFENGSGDTTYNWVLILLILIFAIIGSVIWLAISGKYFNYDRLNYWFMVALRFYVATALIEYGMIKIWKMQFPYPSPYRLMQNYGESSPMGLAWTFLGFSKGYNIFMGIAELFAALLFWRRTVTLGAIITLMTTANVMAINYFYDVPVKIFSTTLFVTTAYILFFNLKDLLLFFFTQNPVTLKVQKAYRFSKKYLNVALVSVKYLIIFFSLFVTAYFTNSAYNQDFNTPKHALFGYYEKSFSSNDSTNSWSKINFVYNDLLRAYDSNGTTNTFSVEIDSLKRQIKLTNVVSKDSTYQFSYKMHQDTLRLSEINKNKELLFLRKNTSNSRLMTRGFHWINEKPYNF